MDVPHRWDSVTGEAEIATAGANEQIDKLAKKYVGKDKYPWAKPEKKRLKVLIRPAYVDSSGFDD